MNAFYSDIETYEVISGNGTIGVQYRLIYGVGDQQRQIGGIRSRETAELMEGAMIELASLLEDSGRLIKAG